MNVVLDKSVTKVPASIVLGDSDVRLVVGKRWWNIDISGKEPVITGGLKDEEVYPIVWKPFSDWTAANKGVVTLFLEGKLTEDDLHKRLKRAVSAKDLVKPRDKKVLT